MSVQKVRRRSKRQKEFLQTIIFFLVVLVSVTGIIAYLWVYTEIDESLIDIEVQESVLKELDYTISELNNRIEYLTRADVIAGRAQKELNMVPAHPETLIVYYSGKYQN